LRGGNHQTLSATVSRHDNLAFGKKYQDLAKTYSEDARRLADQWRGFPPTYEPSFVDQYQGFTVGRPRLGISAEPVTDQLAGFFGVRDGHGVLVSEVTDGSPAAKGGLKAGDVIVAVDGGKIESVSDLRNQLSKKTEGAVVFKVVRNHQETSVTVNLEKVPTSRRVQRVSAPRIKFVRPLQTI